jgi:hypothetical protein
MVVHAPTGALILPFREVGLLGRPTGVADLSQPDWTRHQAPRRQMRRLGPASGSRSLFRRGNQPDRWRVWGRGAPQLHAPSFYSFRIRDVGTAARQELWGYREYEQPTWRRLLAGRW